MLIEVKATWPSKLLGSFELSSMALLNRATWLLQTLSYVAL